VHHGGVKENEIALLQRQLYIILSEIGLKLGAREGEVTLIELL
jgi:hypothetical protein